MVSLVSQAKDTVILDRSPMIAVLKKPGLHGRNLYQSVSKGSEQERMKAISAGSLLLGNPEGLVLILESS